MSCVTLWGFRYQSVTPPHPPPPPITLLRICLYYLSCLRQWHFQTDILNLRLCKALWRKKWSRKTKALIGIRTRDPWIFKAVTLVNTTWRKKNRMRAEMLILDLMFTKRTDNLKLKEYEIYKHLSEYSHSTLDVKL